MRKNHYDEIGPIGTGLGVGKNENGNKSLGTGGTEIEKDISAHL